MMRWHLLRGGRIVQTAWSSHGDTAAKELRPTETDLVVSDADWWAMQHRRALRDDQTALGLALRERETIERKAEQALRRRSKRDKRNAAKKRLLQRKKHAKWIAERTMIMARGRAALKAITSRTHR